MLELRYFCCGCSLEKGVATASGITCFLASVNLIAGCTLYSSMKSQNANYDYTTSFALMLTTSIIAFILGISLIFAIIKRNSALLLPWLIFFCVEIILSCINIADYPTQHVLFYIIYAAILSYLIYLWLVVYSYFRQLRREAMGLPPQFMQTIIISPPQYETPVIYTNKY